MHRKKKINIYYCTSIQYNNISCLECVHVSMKQRILSTFHIYIIYIYTRTGQQGDSHWVRICSFVINLHVYINTIFYIWSSFGKYINNNIYIDICMNDKCINTYVSYIIISEYCSLADKNTLFIRRLSKFDTIKLLWPILTRAKI